MVFAMTNSYAFSAYQHWSCELKSRTCRGVINTILYDKVCQCLAEGLWFSSSTPISSSNYTDHHKITDYS